MQNKGGNSKEKERKEKIIIKERKQKWTKKEKKMKGISKWKEERKCTLFLQLIYIEIVQKIKGYLVYKVKEIYIAFSKFSFAKIKKWQDIYFQRPDTDLCNTEGIWEGEREDTNDMQEQKRAENRKEKKLNKTNDRPCVPRFDLLIRKRSTPKIASIGESGSLNGRGLFRGCAYFCRPLVHVWICTRFVDLVLSLSPTSEREYSSFSPLSFFVPPCLSEKLVKLVEACARGQVWQYPFCIHCI